MPVSGHWQVYVGALLLSLLGTVPLILADERKGKPATLAIAVALLGLGQAMLCSGGGLATVLAALAIFFAGFNFLEAGLPARLSIRAAGEARGASLGVFSSAQFLGAFAGGLLGGRLMADNQPTDVFAASGLLALAWLIFHVVSGRARRRT